MVYTIVDMVYTIVDMVYTIVDMVYTIVDMVYTIVDMVYTIVDMVYTIVDGLPKAVIVSNHVWALKDVFCMVPSYVLWLVRSGSFAGCANSPLLGIIAKVRRSPPNEQNSFGGEGAGMKIALWASQCVYY